MALSAFHAQDTVRADALARLAARIEARQLLSGALLWDGNEPGSDPGNKKGSVAGVLAETADPAEWEARLGLARWMAYALDTVTSRLAPPRALEEVAALLQAVAPGQDTGPLGSRLIVQLLDAAAEACPPAEPLAALQARIAALHQRLLAGQDVVPAEWRQARRDAVQATDTLVPPPAEDVRLPDAQAQQRGLGLMIEAAAWDPQRSATAVSEVLRQWLALEGLKSDEEFGWTVEDDAQIRRLLAEMHATYIVPHAEEKRTVFDFLEIHHDAIATRLRAYMKHGRDHGGTCAERACALLRRLLAAQG